MVTISHLLHTATQQLETFSDTPRLDSECLAAFVLNINRARLLAIGSENMAPQALTEFNNLILQRQKGVPIAYLVKNQEFWSLDLLVTPDTLIPRPETELLVETTLKLLDHAEQHVILDLGTGSGAIAIALAKSCPNWRIIATDINAKTLSVAQHNANKHHLTNITFLESNWFTQLEAQLFSAIISNPPYLAHDDPHLTKLAFEPIYALVAEELGLGAFNIIAKHSIPYLRDEGFLLFEHGSDQANAVSELMLSLGFTHLQTLVDLGYLPRITYGKRP